MESGMKARHIFGALIGVMILTISLSFILNTTFMQKQLSDNLYQKIEYSRDLYKERLLNLDEKDLGLEELLFLQGDNRSNEITILLYDDYGENIGGNITRYEEGINGIKTMMLNGLEDTLYSKNTFYSFTSVDMKQGRVYLMLEMSDQIYRQGVRSYYLRLFFVFMLVMSAILLLGFKLLELQAGKKV